MQLKLAFGEVIKAHRIRLGYSQEHLAHLCELDRTYIGLLERGKRNPSLKTIFVISENLEIAPSSLVNEVEKKITNQTSST